MIVLAGGAAAHADALQDGVSAYMAGDYVRSIRLLGRLADQGDPVAQMVVGGSYAAGFGVEQDCAKGLKMLTAAANGGYARAQYIIGRLNSTGTCMQKNYDAALVWFKKAADQHLADADFTIGLYYSDGAARPKNLVEAYRWFSWAVRDGEKYHSGAPGNILAAKNNVNQLNALLNEADLKKAKALSDQPD